MRKSTPFLILIFAVFLLQSDPALARRRRHHKSIGLFFANQVLKLDGTLTDNGKPALEYSRVDPGDVLETGAQSKAVIRLSGLALFEMGPDTKLKFTRFADRTDTKFEIIKGRALCLFRRPGVHQMLLPHSTLELHGTTFFVQAGPGDNDPDKVCLCDGKIQVSVAEEDDETPGPAPSPTAPLVLRAAPSPAPSSGANAATFANASPAPSPPVVQSSSSPAKTPGVHDLQIVSHNEHKQFEVSDDGITVKDEKLLDFHSDKEIQDMESLYNLP